MRIPDDLILSKRDLRELARDREAYRRQVDAINSENKRRERKELEHILLNLWNVKIGDTMETPNGTFTITHYNQISNIKYLCGDNNDTGENTPIKGTNITPDDILTIYSRGDRVALRKKREKSKQIQEIILCNDKKQAIKILRSEPFGLSKIEIKKHIKRLSNKENIQMFKTLISKERKGNE